MQLRAPTSLTLTLLALLATLSLAPGPALAQVASSSVPDPSPRSTEGAAVVRAVLFFSPSCPHCEHVINDVLPGVFAASGGAPTLRPDPVAPTDDVSFYLLSNPSLELLLVDASRETGARMYEEDSTRLGLAQAGVPRLDIADGMLVGSVDIPDRLPDIIASGLATGGIDWPPVPGITAALAGFAAAGATKPEPEASQLPGAVVPAAASPGPLEKVGRDPLGNGIAIAVLVALLASLIAVPMLAVRGSMPGAQALLTPLLAGLGLMVAAYLAFVETSGGAAVCGPVGDCDAVQASEYARVFGVPIGVLGLLGYGVILVLWGMARAVSGRMADWARLGTAAMAYAGVLFSAYLTTVEPFVIGATCMWCISSALLMLAVLWTSAAPAWSALQRLRRHGPPARHAGRDGSAPAAATRR